MPKLAFFFALLISAQLVAPSFADTSAGIPADEPRVLPQGTVELQVEQLHCSNCAKKLARKLYATPGIKKVKTDVKANLATIQLQPKKTVELAKLWAAAEAAKQKPVAILVLDKKLVAEDFEAEKKSDGVEVATATGPEKTAS
ncbi:MAG: heavy metal-associated domain-containing protein [Planctomycetota bacterium]